MEIKPNNIYHGDSYELIKNIPDKSIDCVYIDIPYLYEHIGIGGVSRALELKDIINGIDYSIFEQLKRVLKKINVFVWCSKAQLKDILNYWTSEDNIIFDILVWCKTNPTPATNNTWLPDIEYCLYFREKGAFLNDGYEIKSKWFVSPSNVNDKKSYNHPTIKPLELVKRHIMHTTKENDIVLDCFLGSGTTAVACKETNRQYIGFEIDETYYKIAIERLNGIDQKGQMSLLDTDFEQLDLFNEKGE